MARLTVGPLSLGKEYDIRGTGFKGPLVRVTVTYPHRAEMYKASVSDGQPLEDSKSKANKPNPYKAGEFHLTEFAEEKGEVAIVVWDWAQRERLAEATVTCG